MSNKKKRQRGSRTHGGGSHKNRRGAGHRGGRGDAGRDKHEMHNHEPLGKSGFSRPEKVQDEVITVDVQTLDEDILLHVADDNAEEANNRYILDARDVVDDGHDADVVKVLGNGQVRNQLEITADAFSEGAREKINGADGFVKLTERASENEANETEN
ncbi:uL15m family ribosomal protein [Halovenus rubra]|uniref:UL15m family ribosomal protein n=2 Tax=Halovenus rubra TaxID=869890 RepID=A0ACC7E5L1_9EURY|nr:uL15m family ribosomal protein [Halovenus rubra]